MFLQGKLMLNTASPSNNCMFCWINIQLMLRPLYWLKEMANGLLTVLTLRGRHSHCGCILFYSYGGEEQMAQGTGHSHTNVLHEKWPWNSRELRFTTSFAIRAILACIWFQAVCKPFRERKSVRHWTAWTVYYASFTLLINVSPYKFWSDLVRNQYYSFNANYLLLADFQVNTKFLMCHRARTWPI